MISSGHDPDHLLSTYSFEQLAVFARCVLRSRVQLLNGILGPVVGATGGEWKDHTVPDPAGKPKKPKAPKSKNHRVFKMSEAGTPEEQERDLLNAFRSVGKRV